FGLYKQTLS
ncbi:hypothetical protein GWI33_017662, partial [Rhynchophorus ferrugineus]